MGGKPGDWPTDTEERLFAIETVLRNVLDDLGARIDKLEVTARELRNEIDQPVRSW